MKDNKKSISVEKLTIWMFVVAIALFNTYVYICKEIDLDILWHYKLGEEILKNKYITISNNFSFLEETEWIPQEWLYEVILYFITNKLGMIGFFGLTCLNTIVTICIAMKNKNSTMLFMLFYTLIWYTTPRNMGNRPSEFSVYLVLLAIYLYNKNIKIYKKALFILFGVFTANFHGGVILIISAIWFIMIANDILFDIYYKNGIKAKKYLSKVSDFMLFIAGSIVNPSGVRLLTTITKISTLNSTQYISEWLPTNVSYLLGVVIGLIVISFGYYIGKYGLNKKDTQLILINVALLILALHSQKAFLVFDITWLVFGYKYLEIMIVDILKNRTMWVSKVTRLIYTLAPAILVVITVASINLIKLNVNTNNFSEYISDVSDKSSNIVINSIKDLYTDDMRVLAGYGNSNLLVFNDIKCFVDTRQWPYARELSKYSALDDLFYVVNNLQDKEYIKNFLDKYEFNYIWTSEKLDLNSYLEDDSNYKLVVSTDNDKESLWKRVR